VRLRLCKNGSCPLLSAGAVDKDSHHAMTEADARTPFATQRDIANACTTVVMSFLVHTGASKNSAYFQTHLCPQASLQLLLLQLQSHGNPYLLMHTGFFSMQHCP